MTIRKQPRSLRASFSKHPLTTTAAVTCCAYGMAAGTALAANNETQKTQLPAVVVETTEAAKGLSNPYANPEAPYMVESLSSSKYTRPIADTPKTLTVIPKEVIADSGATDLADVLRAQPGITLGTGEGGNAFGDRYIIRGFEARNDVFVDGLRDPGVTTRETFAVEQIEVSKGPSSSFAGRGTTGGAINNVTKKPTSDNFTRAEVQFGTDSRHRYTVDNNTVLTDDLALRTNLLYSSRDIPDRGLAYEQRQGGAFALEWHATDDLTVNADYYHQTGESMPDGGVPWDSVADAPVSGRYFYGQNGRDYWDTSSNIGTLGVSYDITKNITLQNLTRYGVTENEYVVTIPGLASATAAAGSDIGLNTAGVYARASSQNRNQENTYLGNQLNLNIESEIAGQKHSWVIGLEVSNEKAENLPFTDSLRSPDAGNPLSPDNNAWLTGGGTLTPNTDRYAELEVDSQSVYVMDTWTINNHWELFGGLRYDTFDYSVNSGPTAYIDTSAQVSNDEGFLNGHFGAVYSPWQNGNVYVGFSTSSNPTGEQFDAFTNCAYGGLCQDGTTNAFPEPEQNTNIELGTKWQLFDNNLLLTGAIFQIEKENVISSSGGRGAPLAFTQVGEMRVRGIEIGATGNITEKLSAHAGLALLDTEITDSDDPTEIGATFPNTAETSANVQLRYQATDQWAVGGTITYTGEIEGGSPNASGTGNTIEDNIRFDFMTEYQVTDAATLRLNVLNVTDEEYYDALYRSGAPFTYVGEGRSAFVTIAYDF